MGGTLGGPGQHGNPWGAPDEGAPWHVPDPAATPATGTPTGSFPTQSEPGTGSFPAQSEPGTGSFPAQGATGAYPAAYPPPTGGYQPPAAPKSRTGWWIAGAVVALVLVLCCGAGLTLFATSGDQAKFDDPAKRQARLAGEGLTAAAATLAQTSGLKYTGTFTDRGDEIPVTAQITHDGWTSAKLTVDDEDVAVLSNGARTYLKASKDYWDSHGAPNDSLDEYAKRWVRVTVDELGFDLSRVLAPGALAADLAAVAQRGEAAGGATSTLDGTEVREVLTPYATAYVTTAAPHRLVRLTAPKDDDGTMSPSDRTHRRAPEIPDEFEFDVSELSEKEIASLFAELEKRVKALKDSVDSDVTFALDGGITLKPCNVNSCTAHVSMSNKVSSASPYLAVNQPVEATISIKITLDGRTVKNCRTTKRMKPNGSAKTSCRATYSVPADGRTHRVLATAKAVARATVSADIKKMFDDLKAERKRAKPSPPPSDGDLGPKWKPCEPRTIDDDKGGCEKVADKIRKQIGGELRTITPPRGATSLGPYRGYDTPWAEHTVVVKNGRVYDAWTPRHGEPIDVYKGRWEYADVLTFGF